MRRIAKFQKVTWEQFREGWLGAFPQTEEEKIREIYDGIRLPRRATAGSAGYDFFSPVDFELKPGETLKMPTGIRAWMEPDWVLKIYPRSGLGFKYRLQLNNTVGIIDSDYYYSDNEGHIFIQCINLKDEDVLIKKGDTVGQAFFQKYLIADQDTSDGVRAGGFGSTDQV